MPPIGFHHSDASRAKMSAAQRKRYEDPAEREKTAAHSRNRVVGPETRAKLSAANIRRWSNPENRAKQSAVRMNHEVAPVTREKLRTAAKARWADPAKRAKMIAGKLAPESRAKLSASLRERFKDPSEREKIGVSQRGEKNHNWKGGISYEPYCPKWSSGLRKRIRAFFEHKCVVCGKTAHENGKRKQLLACHHVTYNRNMCCDGKPVCFAALCNYCHGKTSHDKDRWTAIIHRIIEEIYEGRSYYTKDEWMELQNKDASR